MWSGTLAHNGVCGTGRKEDWASHAMEHEISAVYDVAHGAGLSVVFPAWMTFMAKNHPEKGAQLARRIWGVTEADDHKAAIEGVMKLKQFFKDLGLPVTMDELGVKEPDIDLLVERLHRNKGAVIGGYYPLTSTETRLIYQLTL